MRPHPPVELLHAVDPCFAPADPVQRWALDNFINDGAPLFNEEHVHLQQAEIGFLWTNIENVRSGRRILGMCQLMPPNGDKWTAGRAAAQVLEWFGNVPDFLITLDGIACAEMTDIQFMALVEHELSHCAQKRDGDGQPLFSRETGRPVWATRPHDVEEFVGVVERYGATSEKLDQMVRAVNRGPLIGQADISRACGTCLRLVK